MHSYIDIALYQFNFGTSSILLDLMYLLSSTKWNVRHI